MQFILNVEHCSYSLSSLRFICALKPASRCRFPQPHSTVIMVNIYTLTGTQAIHSHAATTPIPSVHKSENMNNGNDNKELFTTSHHLSNQTMNELNYYLLKTPFYSMEMQQCYMTIIIVIMHSGIVFSMRWPATTAPTSTMTRIKGFDFMKMPRTALFSLFSDK